MAIINDRIRDRRKKINKTLLEIAEYIGVKEATMQRYESGEIKNIPYDNIVLIAECLNCTPQYLMGWSDVIIPDIILSKHEQDLILAYRNQPTMQEAVDRLLNINDSVVVTMAARGTKDTPPQDIKVSKEALDALENAPDFNGEL